MTSPQQLYRELDRMAAESLIESRTVQQERRPNKRMHSLTDRGREGLRAFTAQPTKPTVIRDELLVKVQAFDIGDRAGVRASISESKQRAQTKLDRYQDIRAKLLNGRTEEEYLREAEYVGPYLTLLRGISFEEDNIRWADVALSVIDKRAEMEPAPPE